jgi:tripartite-type tricarboxylate transporter receptor subunit TctC
MTKVVAMRGVFTTALAAMVATVAGLIAAQAQGAEIYPAKPVHLVAPEVPGSWTDVLARILGCEARRCPRPAGRGR